MFARFGVVVLAVFLISAFMIATVSSSKSEAVDSKTAPDVLIKSVIEEVVAIVKKDAKAKSGEAEQKKTVDIVQTTIAPNFDFVAMTRLAVGPHWRKTTPKQQQQLTEEFQKLLLHTYTQILF